MNDILKRIIKLISLFGISFLFAIFLNKASVIAEAKSRIDIPDVNEVNGYYFTNSENVTFTTTVKNVMEAFLEYRVIQPKEMFGARKATKWIRVFHTNIPGKDVDHKGLKAVVPVTISFGTLDYSEDYTGNLNDNIEALYYVEIKYYSAVVTPGSNPKLITPKIELSKSAETIKIIRNNIPAKLDTTLVREFEKVKLKVTTQSVIKEIKYFYSDDLDFLMAINYDAFMQIYNSSTHKKDITNTGSSGEFEIFFGEGNPQFLVIFATDHNDNFTATTVNILDDTETPSFIREDSETYRYIFGAVMGIFLITFVLFINFQIRARRRGF